MNDIKQLQGDYFGGFKMLRLLGQGGNGVVYQAHQLAVGRVTACKILYPEFVSDPVYINNFVREARLAARLEHPNIIQALDVDTMRTCIILKWNMFPESHLKNSALTIPKSSHCSFC